MPWLDGPTPEDRAKDRMWQGGICFLIGALSTGGSYMALGMIWMGTVILTIAGLFWFLVGLVTHFTGYE